MKVWLIAIGEPLPTASDQLRLLRAGILSNLLAEGGNKVTWWTSAFDHFRKRFHFTEDRTIELTTGLRLKLLHGCGYRSNVSPTRLLDHWWIARKFRRQASAETKPDLILCSFPTIELSVEAVRYGLRERVPVVLDIRDFWPDVFVEIVPRALRPLARIMLHPLFRATREACTGATAIIGITPQFVEWGLRQAGRGSTLLDQDFPHGYVEDEPPPAVVEAARKAWQARGLRESDFIACFFGTIGRQFDLETVIRAAKLLRSSCPELKFVVCGDGDRLAHHRTLAADAPNVLFPGWVQFAEIWTLMRMASVGLAPYANETSFTQSIPNKAVEYLSSSLPIVSSLRGVLESLLSRYNCGLTYSEGNSEELARVMYRLYRDRAELKGMSDRAGALYRERFVARSVYGALAEHLEQIVESYRSDRGHSRRAA